MKEIRLRSRVAVFGVLAGACLMAVTATVVAGGGSPVPVAGQGLLPAASPVHGTLPVVAEHRYRLGAKIRPLLLFWIGKDNVGGARIRWRQGENGARGYDLLIGSDPARAPRGVNRWGFILEECRDGEATIVGIMKKSDEESLDEAKANEARGGAVFKMIQATVTRSESVARVTTAAVPHDYSYKQLDALVEALVHEPTPPKIQKTPVPPGGRPGMLTAVAELLRDAVETVTRTGKAPGKSSLSYAYYAKQYDVTRASSRVERQATYGGATYPLLLEADFEVRARRESWTESFTIVCGVDGPLAGVPVYITYQPRWWFKVELVLDEHQTF
jgi:hypothetical protein